MILSAGNAEVASSRLSSSQASRFAMDKRKDAASTLKTPHFEWHARPRLAKIRD
jgi:hypothetical protein